MKIEHDTGTVAQFAFRIVESTGENVWYVAIVKSRLVEATAMEVAASANELQSNSAVVFRVESPKAFETALNSSKHPIWIGFGLESLDEAAWSALDRNRTRLERASDQCARVGSSVVLLVMAVETWTKLQSKAPNLASWIGGSVFGLAPDGELTAAAKETRLTELRLWGQMSDEEVVRKATEGTLPAEPYFAEWLVLLDRGDLLGNG